MFVQIWCQNFLAKIFFGQPKILEGVLLCLSKSGVRIFWPKFFFSQPKILDGGYFYVCPNLVSEFFSQNFFFGQPKILEGVLLCLSNSGVRIFWAKFFLAG